MKAFIRFVFENSILDPAWTALVCGYAVVGFDGQLYLSQAGQDYLEEIG